VAVHYSGVADIFNSTLNGDPPPLKDPNRLPFSTARLFVNVEAADLVARRTNSTRRSSRHTFCRRGRDRERREVRSAPANLRMLGTNVRHPRQRTAPRTNPVIFLQADLGRAGDHHGRPRPGCEPSPTQRGCGRKIALQKGDGPGTPSGMALKIIPAHSAAWDVGRHQPSSGRTTHPLSRHR